MFKFLNEILLVVDLIMAYGNYCSGEYLWACFYSFFTGLFLVFCVEDVAKWM